MRRQQLGDTHLAFTGTVAGACAVPVGEVIATAVGLRATTNVFFDWGVYTCGHETAWPV